MFGKIFKICIVLIALGFLFVYYQTLDNHRYSLKWEEIGLLSVFDTKTGKVYNIGTSGWVSHDPVKNSKPR